MQHPSLNSSGQVAFRADLIGSGVNSSNNKGIWATDWTGTLQPIARAGQQLEVAPGNFRTISDLNFTSASGNSDGLSSGFNNVGQLVFWASFTDGSQGVFVSNEVAHIPGDFNDDGTVDAADYVVWRTTNDTQTGYNKWRANFGRSLSFVGASGSTRLSSPKSASNSAASISATIPEPISIALVAASFTVLAYRRRTLRRSP
jgi:hypothetical protein